VEGKATRRDEVAVIAELAAARVAAAGVVAARAGVPRAAAAAPPGPGFVGLTRAAIESATERDVARKANLDGTEVLLTGYDGEGRESVWHALFVEQILRHMALGTIPRDTVRWHYCLMVAAEATAVVDAWSGIVAPPPPPLEKWKLTRGDLRGFLAGDCSVVNNTSASVAAEGLLAIPSPAKDNELVAAYTDQTTARISLGLAFSRKTFLNPQINAIKTAGH
jgi:hypothetical protein